MNKHKSVLLNEVLNEIVIQDDNPVFVVDSTLGSGGHSKAILEKVKNLHLFCFDIDQVAINRFLIYLKESNFTQQNDYLWEKDKQKIYVFNNNFTDVYTKLQELNIKKVKYLLADLGWAEDQKEYIQGLSFERLEDFLDMRLDKTHNQVTAFQIINYGSLKKLKQFFIEYGDLHREGDKLNQFIKLLGQKRLESNIKTVADLVNIIKVLNFRFKADQVSFCARVFQTLRIAVNMELENLRVLLNFLPSILLEIGSKAMIITFHSGEQKIIQQFKNSLLNKKTQLFTFHELIRPSVDELRNNISSRSAQLNVIERIK
ncbi:MAG: 16S rRNA (cytosine(1402)-N(4))-methyltransferase RsmH [Candidatus Dojkabacteria bacterium]|nr:16S rRNA (cytosine(1402)-N(4))-methyltransferase RsmH [Candidatus Dojkabacteria bacterium]